MPRSEDKPRDPYGRGFRTSDFGFRSDFGFISSFVISVSGCYGKTLGKAQGQLPSVRRGNDAAVPRLAMAFDYETKGGVQAIARL